MLSLPVFVLAALAEIAGCYAVWVWARQGASALWLFPGLASLALFAFALTRVDSDFAGRAFAAYGGIHIVASLAWMWAAEGQRPDGWDLLGGTTCLAGTGIILFAPRGA